jgi:hypothetical protein
MITSSRGDMAYWEYDHEGVAKWELARLPFAVRVDSSDKLSKEQIEIYRKQITGL